MAAWSTDLEQQWPWTWTTAHYIMKFCKESCTKGWTAWYIEPPSAQDKEKMERQRQRSEGFFCLFCLLFDFMFVFNWNWYSYFYLLLFLLFCAYFNIYLIFIITLLVFLGGALQGSGWMWRGWEMGGTAVHDVKLLKNQQKNTLKENWNTFSPL